MKKRVIKVNRRHFLKSSGGIIAGVSALSTLPGNVFAESPELINLSELIYEIFPHNHIPVKYYHQVAQSMLDKASNDNGVRLILDEGLKTANSFYGKPFYTLTASKKTLVMDRLRPTPFYSMTRGHTVVALYNIKEVWPYFGYPGSSFEFGGYIDRQLGDVFWLKNL